MASGLADEPTVYSAFLAAESRFAQRPFLRAPAIATRACFGTALEFTYAAARQEVERLVAGYRTLGMGAGERVALAFDSRLDIYLHLLSLSALGGSAVPLNMVGSDDEILYVIGHSDARLITGADEHLIRLQRLARRAHKVPVVPARDTLGDAGPVLAGGTAASEVALLYTSGTTGKPKGCMLSNDYFLTMGRGYNELGSLCAVDAGDRLVTPLPPNHMNALSTSFMAMMLCGGCVIQLDWFHPASWWQTIREEAATVIHYLGVMPAILLKLPVRDDENFSGQVKFGFGAGADPRHQRLFEQRFGFPLVEAWAMTETGGAGMIVAHREPRHVGQRCFGRPTGHAEVRIVDEAGQDVEPGQNGELLVRRRGADPQRGFFSGYYKDPEATREVWRGGWLHTGDVVRQGPDGSLFFVDRRKNVIRRSGENIAAVEVEAVILELEGIVNCAVTAVRDELRGDEVFAMVIAEQGIADTGLLSQQIFQHCMQSLAYFKAPGYIAFVDELPLTASNKVNRKELRELALECVDSGQALDLRARKKRPRVSP